MRFFIAIFCTYILALAIMPCTDMETCENDVHIISISAHHHDHKEDHGDTCSPFCVCACCGGIMGFILTSNNVLFDHPEKINNPAFISNYNSIFNSAYFYSFWQPPKI
jgi:hypothetical protein